MKQTLIFLFMLASAFLIDTTPVFLEQLQSDTITVTVSGEVNYPGDITLPLYATVSDALAAADVTDDADTSTLNPNTILTDHDVINVPSLSETEIGRISINTATAEQLTALPGIGTATAEKIVAYREENGFFQTLEDLMNVSGIGEAKFAALEDLICL